MPRASRKDIFKNLNAEHYNKNVSVGHTSVTSSRLLMTKAPLEEYSVKSLPSLLTGNTSSFHLLQLGSSTGFGGVCTRPKQSVLAAKTHSYAQLLLALLSG
jgi:hypothetical protein